ncbi:hypothetical protein Bpfe_009124 [Biomphalaria pfeifferi]|uniref:Uncharacterized protein n=1 Tax=Biomphalaria pfeifferi TaxID=112525 RepID=A0AAD8BVA3_BIOPF|nr:hypothetical protein Bpfe_009124 [Biomphalaria pfeifferi]
MLPVKYAGHQQTVAYPLIMLETSPTFDASFSTDRNARGISKVKAARTSKKLTNQVWLY